MVGRLLKGVVALDHRWSRPTRLLAALGAVLHRDVSLGQGVSSELDVVSVPLGQTVSSEQFVRTTDSEPLA